MMNTLNKKQRPGQVCVIIDPSIKRDAKVYAAMHGITLNRLYEEAVKAYLSGGKIADQPKRDAKRIKAERH